jgi:hypothetical protein
MVLSVYLATVLVGARPNIQNVLEWIDWYKNYLGYFRSCTILNSEHIIVSFLQGSCCVS